LLIRQSRNLGFGGYIDQAQIREAMKGIEVPELSPFAVADAGLSPAGVIYAHGQVVATKPLFPGLTIPFAVEGNEISLDFAVPFNKLALGPVRVTEASMRLGAGEDGLFLSGGAALEIASLGHGWLEARVEEGGPT